MRELADAVVLGAARQGLQMCRLTGMVLQGWAFVQAGQEEAGIAQIQQGLTECRTQGIGASLPRYCALLAEAYRDVGRTIPGLALLAEAQGVHQAAWRAYLCRQSSFGCAESSS